MIISEIRTFLFARSAHENILKVQKPGKDRASDGYLGCGQRLKVAWEMLGNGWNSMNFRDGQLDPIFIYTNITGWWFGTVFIFPYIGNFIIPIDFIFFRGIGLNHQPDKYIQTYEILILSMVNFYLCLILVNCWDDSAARFFDPICWWGPLVCPNGQRTQLDLILESGNVPQQAVELPEGTSIIPWYHMISIDIPVISLWLGI